MEKIKELNFSQDSHEYTYDSKRIPSVTQVINFIYGPRNISDFYLQRGAEVHAIINSYIRKTLIEESIDDQLKGYFMAVKRFFRWTGKTYAFSEGSFYSKRGYAGTRDLELIDRDWIIDFKTGDPDDKRDAMQLIAYADSNRNYELYNVYLKDSGNYRIIKRPWDKVVYNIFLAGVSILNYTRRF